MNMSLVPYVVEQTNRGERSYDIFSRLLNDRIIILNEEVNNASAGVVVVGGSVDSGSVWGGSVIASSGSVVGGVSGTVVGAAVGVGVVCLRVVVSLRSASSSSDEDELPPLLPEPPLLFKSTDVADSLTSP